MNLVQYYLINTRFPRLCFLLGDLINESFTLRLLKIYTCTCAFLCLANTILSLISAYLHGMSEDETNLCERYIQYEEKFEKMLYTLDLLPLDPLGSHAYSL